MLAVTLLSLGAGLVIMWWRPDDVARAPARPEAGDVGGLRSGGGGSGVAAAKAPSPATPDDLRVELV